MIELERASEAYRFAIAQERGMAAEYETALGQLANARARYVALLCASGVDVRR